VVPTSRRIYGGLTSNFHLANGLVQRGHEVSVVHVDLLGFGIGQVADLPWFTFDERVDHQFVEYVDYRSFPDADFVFTMSEQDGIPPTRKGLPLLTIRAHGLYTPRASNDQPFFAPYPKVVPARWLVDIGRRLGVRQEQLVLVPNGIDHEKYRLTRPIEGRSPRASMVHSNHPTKGSPIGLQALALVKQEIPEFEAVVFGHTEPRQQIPPWITFRLDPPQREIVDKIYNRSAVFISPSLVEGFGLPCVEAMACGCALVTTDNGGSREYAIPGQTALVCPPKDSRSMAANITELLRDEGHRVSLSRRGREYVTRFDWETSTETLERFLISYGEAPTRYLG
jgi:L-malate glycosyltransferase